MQIYSATARLGTKRIARQVTKPRRTRVSPPKLGEMQGAFRLPPAWKRCLAPPRLQWPSSGIDVPNNWNRQKSYRESSAR